MTFLSAGIPVVLVEMNPQALEKGVATIRSQLRGRGGEGQAHARRGRRRAWRCFSRRSSYDDLGAADLVIEAVFEDMEIKREVFATLDRVMKPGAILATNTSTLDVDQLAAATRRPQDVVGMHFFSPANVMKLLEVVRGDKTGADVLATVMQLARRIGKTAVVAARVRRLHRQPDDRALPAAGDVPRGRGRVAGAGRRARSRSSAWRWGRSA